MKKAAPIAAVILIIVVVFVSLPDLSYAKGFANYEKAVDLKILGLLGESENGLDLGRVPDKLDGAVMLVRLLGKEKQALQTGFKHPFKDVPLWADRYVGYLYQNKLATGVGKDKFGSGVPLSALLFVSFVLHALGYDDVKYGDSLDKAVKIGLLTADAASSFKSGRKLTGDDLAGITYAALDIKLEGSDRTLLDKLVLDDKTVHAPAAAILGLYTSKLKSEVGNIDNYSPASTGSGYVAKNAGDLFLILRKHLYEHRSQFKVDLSGYGGDAVDDFEAAAERAHEAVKLYTGTVDFLDSWDLYREGPVLTVTLTYFYTKEVFDSRREKAKKAVSKARQIVSGLIDSKMSDYEKEKLLHDYIVNNTRNDVKNFRAGIFPEDSFTAYGCLVQGFTMCQGYANGMKLLSDLAGLECLVIVGKADDDGKQTDHAWNLVKVDGSWYHLDVTYDDPVIEDGKKQMLVYHYFNLNDAEAGRIYSWDKSGYPACNSTRYGYYNKNKLLAGNHQEFANAVKAALKKRPARIELKVKDYTHSGYSDLSDIMFSNDAVASFNYLVDEEFGVFLIFQIKYF